MKKRLFAILLTVFMIASLLPTGAFAAEAVTYIERSWDEEQGKVVETRKEITDYTLISRIIVSILPSMTGVQKQPWRRAGTS